MQKLRSLWSSIRLNAEGAKTSLRAGLSRATLEALEGSVLTLRVPDPPAGEVIKRDIAAVKKAIADVTGRTVDVRVTIGAAVPPATGGAATGVSNDQREDHDDLMRYALEKLT